eukprot:TRINITY_DN22833_c0_g1_i1.p1 TRINITY_DN22833_c0_g1~~TRINITY_DN22833_c0_g1_i1.p1  ORF type:complete len:412 (-),score=76.13 TRINITY_DN22833_c0_g1_i1:56-1246(-)
MAAVSLLPSISPSLGSAAATVASALASVTAEVAGTSRRLNGDVEWANRTLLSLFSDVEEQALDSTLPAMSGAETVLLLTSAVLFGLTAILALREIVRASQRLKDASTPAMAAGARTRRGVVLGFFLATGFRCVSLVVQLQEGGKQPLRYSQRPWLTLLELLPTAVFLTAFSLVARFWAWLHNTATMVPMPPLNCCCIQRTLLDCFCIILNVVSYVLIATITVVAVLLGATEHLWTYVSCVLGILNVAVALVILCCGLAMISEVGSVVHKKIPGRRLPLRVMLLTAACPALFMIRGAYYMVWDTLYEHQNRVIELVLILLGEWLPTVLTILILNPSRRTSPRTLGLEASSAVQDESTDSDAGVPLLGDDEPPQQRVSLGSPPSSAWHQLYPEQTASS